MVCVVIVYVRISVITLYKSNDYILFGGDEMKRMILAATEGNEALDDAIKDLEADFDYIIEGLEKLSRTSTDKGKEALSIALEFSQNLVNINNSISNAIIE